MDEACLDHDANLKAPQSKIVMTATRVELESSEDSSSKPSTFLIKYVS